MVNWLCRKACWAEDNAGYPGGVLNPVKIDQRGGGWGLAEL